MSLSDSMAAHPSSNRHLRLVESLPREQRRDEHIEAVVESVEAIVGDRIEQALADHAHDEQTGVLVLVEPVPDEIYGPGRIAAFMCSTPEVPIGAVHYDLDAVMAQWDEANP